MVARLEPPPLELGCAGEVLGPPEPFVVAVGVGFSCANDDDDGGVAGRAMARMFSSRVMRVVVVWVMRAVRLVAGISLVHGMTGYIGLDSKKGHKCARGEASPAHGKGICSGRYGKLGMESWKDVRNRCRTEHLVRISQCESSTGHITHV